MRRFSDDLAHRSLCLILVRHFSNELVHSLLCLILVRRFSNELAHSTNVSHSGVRFGETFGETVRRRFFSKIALARLTIT